MPTLQEPKIISGNANRTLAKAVARRLSMHRGMNVSLVDARVERFNDGEILAKLFADEEGEGATAPTDAQPARLAAYG